MKRMTGIQSGIKGALLLGLSTIITLSGTSHVDPKKSVSFGMFFLCHGCNFAFWIWHWFSIFFQNFINSKSNCLGKPRNSELSD